MRRWLGVAGVLATLAIVLTAARSVAEDPALTAPPETVPTTITPTTINDDERRLADEEVARLTHELSNLEAERAALAGTRTTLETERVLVSAQVEALEVSLAETRRSYEATVAGLGGARRIPTSQVVVVPRDGRLVVRLASARPEAGVVQPLEIDEQELLVAIAEFEVRLSDTTRHLEGIDAGLQVLTDNRADLDIRIADAERLLGEARARQAATLAVVPPALPVGVTPAHQPLASSVQVSTALSTVGIPIIADVALRQAIAATTSQKPDCKLSFGALAAISQVESNHGRYGGSRIDADGRVVPVVRGPALDGVRFALIRDTDGGRYDGDTVYDRAMGPMQFIPTSWSALGRDGDNDGRADPDNYYDAALAAAFYLCNGHSNLDDPSRLATAIFSYNPSHEYVRLVAALAQRYNDANR